MVDVAENVKKFIDHCSEGVADFEAWRFQSSLIEHFDDLNVLSPIEQLFAAALETALKITRNQSEDWRDANGEWHFSGVAVSQQIEIGKYRVDFLLQTDAHRDVIDNTKTPARSIVVELDGHKFHDTTEEQRRYEKERDRFMQNKGFKVFRFTGSEVVKNPFKVVCECLEGLGIDKTKYIMAFAGVHCG